MRKIVQLCVVLLLCLNGMAVDVHLTGRVFFDNDRTHSFTEVDSAFYGAKVKFTSPTSIVYTAVANRDGNYDLYIPEGDYYYSLVSSYNTARYDLLGEGIMTTSDNMPVDFSIPLIQSLKVIGGTVVYDNNRNRKFDAGDELAPKSKVNFSNQAWVQELNGVCDSFGVFRFYGSNYAYGILTVNGHKSNYLEEKVYDFQGGFRELKVMLQPNLPGKAHIDGLVFYDPNGNQIYDDWDSVISNSTVTATNIKTLVQTQTLTDDGGNYFFNIDTGYYKIEFNGNYNKARYLAAIPKNGYYPLGNISLNEETAPYRVNFALRQKAQKPIHITGRAYYDNSGNYKFDSNDSAIVKGGVIIRKRMYLAPSAYRESYETTTTDADGYYYIGTDLADEMAISLNQDTYNTQNYRSAGFWQVLNYTGDTTDVVDFVIQKKDSIESTTAIVINANETWQPIGAGTQHYNLAYGYDGWLDTLSITVTLDFNPVLTLSTTSKVPTKSIPGHLEWKLPFSKRGMDTIRILLNFPPVGDTISAFVIHPTITPEIKVANQYGINAYDYTQRFDAGANSFGIGSTKGVKWIRSFPDAGVPYSQEDYAYSIDTVGNGRYYYMTCDRTSASGLGGTANQKLVVKLDKNGLNVWEREIAGFSEPVVTHLSDGGCAVLGTVYEYEDGNYESLIKDVQVARFDSLGGLIWQKRLSGLKHEQHTGITQSADGSIIITGTTRSYDGNFVGNQADTTHSNVFLTKMSATGNIVWTKVYGGSRNDEGGSVVRLKNNTLLLMAVTQSVNGDVKGAHQHAFKEIIAAGSYYNDMYYTKADSIFASEAWVLNIDANGNILWSKCYGGTAESIITGAAENSGGYLLAGITNSKDGDLAYYKETFAAVWLTQISATGQIIWNKTYKTYGGYAGDGSDTTKDYLERNTSEGGYTTRLHGTKDGNFVLGVTSSDQYGDVKAKHGKSDIVLLKINSLGNIVWQKAIGGTKDEYLFDIQIDNNDDVLFVGYAGSQNDDLYEPVNNNYALMLVGKFGITNTISGHVFTDLNGNHLKDANEVYNNEGRIYSAKQSDTTIARIFGGQFLNNVDTGNYVTTYVPASEYFTVFPASKNSAFTSFDQSDSVDFALVPKANIKDLQTVITPLTPARPGFESSYRIITKNVGTTNITNAVISLKKDGRQTFTSASRPNTGIAADSVWWGPFNINAFTNDTLDVVLTQAVPPVLQNGDTLNIALYALPLANDTTPVNNKASLRQIVQGSFDPNDKTEAHAGIYTPTMKASNEPFQYLIRFQNTGTDTAFYVTVKDTLEAKVDVNSLETITASHAYKFSLEGRIATWQFNKILLVDSTTNEPASHGFISFTVKPSATLKLGDSVTNKAAIYFDFNLPVITNKSLLLLVSDKSAICPGGSTQFQAGQTGIGYQWQINTGNGFANLANGGIYSGATTQTLLISNAPSNLYGIQYRCLVTLPGGGKINSDTYKLTFSNTWTGTVSSAWENGSNWSCGSVPDENTDVIIKAGTPNTPSVNAATTVRSISASTGAKVMVKSGVVLGIKGK